VGERSYRALNAGDSPRFGLADHAEAHVIGPVRGASLDSRAFHETAELVRVSSFVQTRRVVVPTTALLVTASSKGTKIMLLYTIAVIFLIAWGVGLITAHTMGGFLHLLLVVAVVLVLVRIIVGRRSNSLGEAAPWL
jgi:hypothetical protein